MDIILAVTIYIIIGYVLALIVIYNEASPADDEGFIIGMGLAVTFLWPIASFLGTFLWISEESRKKKDEKSVYKRWN